MRKDRVEIALRGGARLAWLWLCAALVVLAFGASTALAVPSVIATGVVTDAATGAPIKGAKVVADWHDTVADEYWWAGEDSADASGAFAVQDWNPSGPRPYELSVFAEGFVPQARDVTWGGTEPLVINFALVRAPAIATGVVTDAATGVPIKGAAATAFWYYEDVGVYGGIPTDRTDLSGAFALYDYSSYGAGRYAFFVEAEGYISQEKNISWDGAAPLVLDFALVKLQPVMGVSGPNRFDTAVKASKLAFPNGAGTVVIATGHNWPDALGGTSLAGTLDGPILLVDTGAVPAAVTAEIARLGAKKAIIVGGMGAVGGPVEQALKAKLGVGNVERIAGANRYQTADAIARRVIAELGPGFDGTAFVATGANFPDALAAAPLAARQGWPLFLADPVTGLSSSTRVAMRGVTNAIVLGGNAVVTPATENVLKAMLGTGDVERLSGPNRYATAVAVADFATKAGYTWNRVGITTGLNFPDALAGGVLQGKAGSVTLLTEPTSLSPATRAALSANKATIDSVTFFGGTGAVSKTVRNHVYAALK